MRIVGVAWRGFAVPFRRPYVTSNTLATVRYGLLVFLYTDGGLAGIGEASPPVPGSERDVENTASVVAGLAPELLGTDVPSVDVAQRVKALRAAPWVRFGVETALLDLKGKATGRPVVELLGGSPGPVEVNFLIASGKAAEAVQEAREAVSMGFGTLKLKVATGAIAEDEALVAAVRGAVGTGVRIRVDANGGWRVAQAIEAVRRLATYGLEYVEQPVSAGDMEGLREVRRATSVPIAADEAIGSAEDASRLLAMDAADVLVVKAGRLGGLHSCMEVIRMGAKAGKAVVVTSSLESGVGVAASAHLAAAVPVHLFAHGLATGLLLTHDLASGLRPIGALVTILRAPGLQVAAEGGALDRYSIAVRGLAGSWPS
ncbi:MAG: o-succinylbenzoate synthase [Chloroflexi bacterium]|nr:o-succinylbenzoate synthase [Chloroflexota bacterium]